MSATDCGCIFLFNYLDAMFLCVAVTKEAQFNQFDWPRKLRSQVSIYNIDVQKLEFVAVNAGMLQNKFERDATITWGIITSYGVLMT